MAISYGSTRSMPGTRIRVVFLLSMNDPASTYAGRRLGNGDLLEIGNAKNLDANLKRVLKNRRLQP